jgi:catechol 2,3-dioxygenase-like lactoylglutathione lyase family enzyme
MPSSATLGSHNIVAFVNIVDIDLATRFYRDTLGLRFLGEELPFALVFDANGIMLRLVIAKKLPPIVGTVLGWNVPDAAVAVKELMSVGVAFERFNFMSQDDLGIWTTPTGAKVAWFKDPDGNLLSVSQHPE